MFVKKVYGNITIFKFAKLEDAIKFNKILNDKGISNQLIECDTSLTVSTSDSDQVLDILRNSSQNNSTTNNAKFDTSKYKISKFLIEKQADKINPFINRYIQGYRYMDKSTLDTVDLLMYIYTLASNEIINMYGIMTIPDMFIIYDLVGSLNISYGINDFIHDIECNNAMRGLIISGYTHMALGHVYDENRINDIFESIHIVILALFMHPLVITTQNITKYQMDQVISEMTILSKNLDPRIIDAFWTKTNHGEWISFALKILIDTIDLNKVAPLIKEAMIDTYFNMENNN